MTLIRAKSPKRARMPQRCNRARSKVTVWLTISANYCSILAIMLIGDDAGAIIHVNRVKS